MPSGSSDQCAVQFTLENLSITACFAVVFCVSFIGNVVVILTIARRHVQQFQSITNLYLLNLAIADLLRSVICMPSTLLSELSHCWLLGPFFCTAAAYLQPATVCASEYTLVVIAVERFYAICRPLQSRKWRSKQRALWMIFFVWIVSFVSNIGSIFIFEAVPYKNAWNCISIGEPLFDFFYQFYVTLVGTSLFSDFSDLGWKDHFHGQITECKMISQVENCK
ncbi:hypothetical protein AB6A40_009561 [Gnathostoma spinigerum]|uniref:G-protein coupled receptors family 1 profile domain-containing protein n=1 Tax=Gnathostoma spinigerum TaxID=75299 RepID=A0ABD6F118_9BILA